MTIAIQRNTDGADTIYFDAVLSYSSSYNAKLSSHPIDGGSSVDDHVVVDNPTFSLRGVVSGSDFGVGRPLASEYKLINQTTISDYTNVLSATDSLYNKVSSALLPFGQTAEPEVTVGTRSSTSIQIVKNLLISIRDNAELVTLVEFTNAQPTQTELDLVITGLQFSEDPNTGDGLNVDMTLQRANFVDLKWTKVNVNTSGKTKDAAQPVADKGSQTSDVQTGILLEAAGSSLLDPLFKVVDKVKLFDGIPDAILGKKR